jgi:hypothetical protein
MMHYSDAPPLSSLPLSKSTSLKCRIQLDKNLRFFTKLTTVHYYLDQEDVNTKLKI